MCVGVWVGGGRVWVGGGDAENEGGGGRGRGLRKALVNIFTEQDTCKLGFSRVGCIRGKGGPSPIRST